MKYVITGATGHLGRLVVEALLERDVPAHEIVAVGRAVDRISDLADRGVQVRAVDYDDVSSLQEAFRGAQKVLLVSGNEVGQRTSQHQNAISAAQWAGVELLAYTSVAKADQTSMQLAADHLATEKALADSGIPHALLRNAWYLENYTAQLATFLEHGAILGSAGDGLVSAAARADYAEAAAAVLLSDDQVGRIYELGGDVAFTLAQLAQTVGEAAGRSVEYRDLPVGEYTQALVGAGLPKQYAAILADSDRGIARGDLLVTTGDLSRLLGRSATTLQDAVRAAVALSDIHA
jgi:NAD(P)H dehydrogenase (quinone)